MAFIVLTPEQVASVLAQAGGSPTPQPTPVPVPPVQPPVGGINVVDLGWANVRVEDITLPVAIKFRTGSISSGGSLPFVTCAELHGGPSPRYAVLSTTPGDFDHPLQGPMGSYGSVSGPSNSVTIRFALGTGATFPYTTLALNTEYYVNIRDAGEPGGLVFVDLSINSL